MLVIRDRSLAIEAASARRRPAMWYWLQVKDMRPIRKIMESAASSATKISCASLCRRESGLRRRNALIGEMSFSALAETLPAAIWGRKFSRSFYGLEKPVYWFGFSCAERRKFDGHDHVESAIKAGVVVRLSRPFGADAPINCG